MWNAINSQKVEKIHTFDDVIKHNQKLPDMEITENKDENAVIKIYLSEVIADCIKHDLSDRPRQFSKSDIVREILLTHCYGRMALKNNNWKRDKRLFNRAKYQQNIIETDVQIADLGKSYIPMSISCHKVLKDHLTILADMRYLNLSEYVREILIIYYLGNGFMPSQDPFFKREESEE